MTEAIVTRDLYKHFPVGEDRTTSFMRLSKLVTGIYRKPAQINVLNGINLSIPRGSKIALLGNNGAGKSTLLRTLAGIYSPSSGSIESSGKLTLLAGWGIGMVNKLTVRQNVYLLGAIHGFYRHEIDRIYPDILRWAEIENFESNRLYTLSTGMKTRLAFSTVRHVQSDIFLLDEAFSAGDQNFQERCKEHFLQERNRDRTYIIATHNPDSLAYFCTEALWLEDGGIREFGPANVVIESYKSSKRSTR